MLKRKLYKACLIMSSFISMAATFGNRSIGKKPVVSKSATRPPDTSELDSSARLVVKNKQAKAPVIQLNKNAAPFVKEYIKKNGYFLGKTRGRIAPYFTIMDSVFALNEMPVELKYLSFVESGLKHNAKTWSGAVGPWAFMPVAAKEYGLKISGKKDERLDYNKSTLAAAGLLNNLYAQFGDWLLVIAAYNCGPGGVQKAIKRSGSRNYWALQQFLPEETRKHVKKFIAVHYYFEGKGSLATLTKAEAQKHIKAMEAYESKQKEIEKMDSLSAVTVK